MKTISILATWAILSASLNMTAAQEAPAAAPATSPTQGISGGRGAAAANANPASASRTPSAEGTRLPENVTLKVSGNLATGIPVELSCTSAGPHFEMEYIVSETEINGNKEPIVGHFGATITTENGAYRIDYNCSIQRPIVSASRSGGGGGQFATVTYRNLGLNSSVLLKIGQTVATSTNSDGQNLTLSLSKP